MRFLIAGSGQFASNWVLSKHTKQHENVLGGRKKNLQIPAHYINIDWLNLKQAQKTVLELKPDVLINAAAITNVDLCEKKPSMAKDVNEKLPLILALACTKLEIPLVHLSTDHFHSSEYSVRDEEIEPIPVNIYGETKLNAEKNIILNAKKFIIIRTNFFGYAPPYSITSLMKLENKIKKSQVYYGSTDIRFSPVSIDFLIESVMKLVKKNFNGLINISGDTCISKFDFARLVAKSMKKDDSNILPTSSKNLPLKALRPSNMCLANLKMKNLLNLGSVSLEKQMITTLNDGKIIKILREVTSE